MPQKFGWEAADKKLYISLINSLLIAGAIVANFMVG